MSVEEKGQVRRVGKFLPNAITLSALSLGISSIYYGLQLNWKIAVLCVILASILDAMDGKVARLLQTQSRIGAELDSLSDLIAFGVSPALLMYLWSLQEFKPLSWAVVIFYVICAALRLARFNVDSNVDIHRGKFFYGCPSPSAALLVLTPLMISLGTGFSVKSPFIVGGFILFAGILMITSIPMFSQKKLKISRNAMVPMLIFITLIVTGLVLYLWIVIPLLMITYVFSIPFSYFAYRGEVRLLNNKSENDKVE